MNNIKFLAIIFCFVFILSCASAAPQEDPGSFRGIKWGTNINAVKNIVLKSTNKNEKFCEINNDNPYVGNIQPDAITYTFYKNNLYGAEIKFHSLPDFQALKEQLVSQYGSYSSPNQNLQQYLWDGIQTRVYLDFNEVTKTGTVLFNYKPILKRKTADEKEKGA